MRNEIRQSALMSQTIRFSLAQKRELPYALQVYWLREDPRLRRSIAVGCRGQSLCLTRFRIGSLSKVEVNSV